MIKAQDVITNADCYSQDGVDYICYLVKNPEDQYEIITCSLRNEIGDLSRAKMSKIKVCSLDSDAHVIGKLICPDDTPTVYIMCMYSLKY